MGIQTLPPPTSSREGACEEIEICRSRMVRHPRTRERRERVRGSNIRLVEDTKKIRSLRHFFSWIPECARCAHALEDDGPQTGWYPRLLHRLEGGDPGH